VIALASRPVRQWLFDSVPSTGEDRRMRFPWRSREYERTCVECGYTWRVPRSAARRRVGSISAFSVAPAGSSIDRAELAREINSIEAENSPAETLRHCPECGADDFTQRALRGGSSG
jgi:predicted nucleic-acid-binding Zn-ribbon protein